MEIWEKKKNGASLKWSKNKAFEIRAEIMLSNFYNCITYTLLYDKPLFFECAVMLNWLFLLLLLSLPYGISAAVSSYYFPSI